MDPWKECLKKFGRKMETLCDENPFTPDNAHNWSAFILSVVTVMEDISRQLRVYVENLPIIREDEPTIH